MQKGAQGVICLLSALQFHELTTQLPFQVWMAIPNKARQPKVDGLQMRFARFSGSAFDEGIETHTIEHIQVRIYNPKPWRIASNTETKSAWMWLLRACETAFENGKLRWMTSITSHRSVG